MTSTTHAGQEVLELFISRRALLKGHFLLSSGLHSDQYLQSALLLQYPEIAANLGEKLASKFRGPVDTVVSPAVGGLIIGHEVARAKGCRAIFSEKDAEGNPILRREFSMSTKEKVLIIEDVITTGRSTREVIRLLKEFGANLIGIGSIVNRVGSAKFKFPDLDEVKVHSLANIEIMSWAPKVCPLCKEGVPVVKPGSRKA